MTDANAMFCFQCEQTIGCSGCTGAAGACGKQASTAQVQDELTGALVGLARTVRAAGVTGDARRAADDLVMEGLFATLTNVDFDDAELESLVRLARAQKALIAADAGMDQAPDLDLREVWNDLEDVRSLRSLVLFGLRGMAAYAYHAAVLGYRDEAVSSFMHEGLEGVAVAQADELLPLALMVGEVNLRCMELLDQANTQTFGTPEPTTVSRTVEAGPFIVATGHDLHDLKLLLDQTAGRGVNVYTHGELLPAHAYPLFKQYPHLKGNLGTAWQNQRDEFAELPAPILFTTNCLMPPASSYADRVFTTGVVAYPGAAHIGAAEDGSKDFGPVIERALELGGFVEPRVFAAIEGSRGESAGADASLVTGFGHGAILGVADTVVDAVKQGAISHFFLVGGCDGARPGRSYFREFVQKTPEDSIVLTLACGKFRFNDLDLGSIGGLPRLMDMGQCNDAYGAIKVAVALAEAFECGVNDLPLTLVLSWYEQKAVCILLTLLHLGIKGIYLGPTLPAFVSPAVLDVLVREFDVHPVGDPEHDLAAILKA
ncbi:MAG: Hydroxylamine reductase [Paraeggerthella hongkongensis]